MSHTQITVIYCNSKVGKRARCAQRAIMTTPGQTPGQYTRQARAEARVHG